MKGYRLTSRGWIALFSIILLVIIVLFLFVEKSNAPIAPAKIVDIDLTKEKVMVIIYFNENDVTIQKQNMPILDMVIKGSEGLEIYKYSIVTHLIKQSEKISNQSYEKYKKLITDRQNKVKEYLIEKGIPEENIDIKEVIEETGILDPIRLDQDKNLRKVEILLFAEK